MNGKQRNTLRAMANKLQPLVTIGKQGLSDSVIDELNEVLDAKELIKISVLKNASLDSKELIQEIAQALKAEPVTAIGNKIVIYRKSRRKDIDHIKI